MKRSDGQAGVEDEPRASLSASYSWLRLALLAAIAGTGVMLMSIAAQASLPITNGVIAYSDNSRIWAENPVNGEQVPITIGPDDSWPAFSLGGSMLAFQRGHGPGAIIYVAQADGENPRPVVQGEDPAFSPDGEEIAFSRANGLYIMSPTGAIKSRRVTYHVGDRDPQWSRSGALAYESTDQVKDLGTTRVVMILPHPGDPVHMLVAGGARSLWPAWSPDGTKLAIATCAGGGPPAQPSPPSEVLGTPPLTSFPTVVFHNSCADAVWAPDGSRLAEPTVVFSKQGSVSTCPETGAGGAVAWQPLFPLTPVLTTYPCEERISSVPRPEAAGGIVQGAMICVYAAHHRRRVCIDL